MSTKPPEENGTTQLNVRVSEELKQAVKRESKQRKLTSNWLMSVVLNSVFTDPELLNEIIVKEVTKPDQRGDDPCMKQ